jgi:uncharacterized protein (DUF1697 family)
VSRTSDAGRTRSQRDRAVGIALLRGINVGGHNRVPMPALRTLCEELGWGDVQTYIQSGNVVFRASTPLSDVAGMLEQAIVRRFQLTIPVIVRDAADWAAYIEGNPFPAASRDEPKLVMLALSKQEPAPGAAKLLQERASGDERIEQVGDALWIHYAAGVAGTKLSPGLLDRVVGSAVTTRNWRTVQKLGELAGQMDQ